MGRRRQFPAKRSLGSLSSLLYTTAAWGGGEVGTQAKPREEELQLLSLSEFVSFSTNDLMTEKLRTHHSLERTEKLSLVEVVGSSSLQDSAISSCPI